MSLPREDGAGRGDILQPKCLSFLDDVQHRFFLFKSSLSQKNLYQ